MRVDKNCRQEISTWDRPIGGVVHHMEIKAPSVGTHHLLMS